MAVRRRVAGGAKQLAKAKAIAKAKAEEAAAAKPHHPPEKQAHCNSFPPPPPLRLSKNEYLLIALILLASAATRFYRIAEPARIVFDEFHFSQFVDEYASGKYFFDIHPPVGKLVLYLAARLGGYKPAVNYEFDAIGKPFGDVMYVPQRMMAAAFGTLIPATLYLTCRALDLTSLAALVAATLSLTDTLLLIESRLVLTDSQLIFYIQASLLFALLLWKTPKRTPARAAYLIATAVFGGCAISTKWTALVAPVMIAAVSLTGAVFPLGGEKLELYEMAVGGLVAVAIYAAAFYLHFWLLPATGNGDAFMPCWFRRHLIGQATCKSADGVVAPSFWRKLYYLNKEMYRANSQISQRHSWEAAWYEWIGNSRGLLYLNEFYLLPGMPGRVNERIYLIVNPFLAPLVVVTVVVCILWLCSRSPWRTEQYVALPLMGKASRGGEDEADAAISSVAAAAREGRYYGVVAFFLAGYVLNILPYVAVRRCTFIYHYLPSLQHAIILAALAVDVIVPKRKFLRTGVAFTVIAGAVAALSVWLPWVYGLPRSGAEQEALQLMPGWT